MRMGRPLCWPRSQKWPYFSYPHKLRAYVDLGISRISMGLQVIQPDLLKVLARDENGIEHHKVAVDNMRRAGFARINLDVMYGFADQTDDSLRATLLHTIGLGPEFITLYRMRYKLTRISHQASRATLAHVKAHAALARSVLEEAGYVASPGKNTYVRGDLREAAGSLQPDRTGTPLCQRSCRTAGAEPVGLNTNGGEQSTAT